MCPICKPVLSRQFRSFEVDIETLAKQGHFRLAHIEHKYEHTKSKFRGPFRRPKYLESFLKEVVTNCRSLARRQEHFVHEINVAGEHIFSYQFFVRNRRSRRKHHRHICGWGATPSLESETCRGMVRSQRRLAFGLSKWHRQKWS